MTVIFLFLAGIIIYFITRSFRNPQSAKTDTYKFTPLEKRATSEETQEAVDILRQKHTVEEITEQASQKEQIFLWYDIDHLSDNELIFIAEQLNKTQLRRWFNYFHNREWFHFPDKAYARIQAKLNDQVWFSDEEYAAREAAGKRSTFMTTHDLLIKQFVAIFFEKSIGLQEKIIQTKALVIKKNKRYRLDYMVIFFDVAYEKIKQRVVDEGELKRLRNIKNNQTRALHSLKLTEDTVNFAVLDEMVRRYPTWDL
jgi:hypothetical protein